MFARYFFVRKSFTLEPSSRFIILANQAILDTEFYLCIFAQETSMRSQTKLCSVVFAKANQVSI